MYRIALCDDDEAFIEKLRSSLVSIFKENDCLIKIFAFNNGEDLLKAAETDIFFDIVFLDIQMPELDGFTIAKRLRELDSAFTLLFTTNIENYACEGYKYDAFRYVLKRRLLSDVKEAVNKIILQSNDNATGNREMVFNTAEAGGVVTVKINDILYLELINRRVKMVTVYGEYYLLKYPLIDYREKLDEDSFVTILRSYLVNLKHIEGFEQNNFILTGNRKISMGNTKKSINESKEKFLHYCKERM